MSNHNEGIELVELKKNEDRGSFETATVGIEDVVSLSNTLGETSASDDFVQMPLPPLKEQIKKITMLVVPATLSACVCFINHPVILIFVGSRMGKDNLAYYITGISIFNLFGVSIGEGLISALDTLISQEYGRHGQNTPEIGVYMQKIILICVIITIPITLFFFTGTPVFCLMFGKELGTHAGRLLSHSIPALFLAMMVNVLVFTCDAINMAVIPLCAMVPSLGISIVVNYYFTKGDDFIVAIYVLTFVLFMQCLLIITTMMLHPKVYFYKKCLWPDPAILHLHTYSEYMRIAFPSLVTILAEWWAYEMLQIIAAHISVESVVLIAISCSVIAVLYCVPEGICTAGAACVGHALGEGNGKLAFRYGNLLLIIQFFLKSITITLLLIFRDNVASLYTKDEELQREFAGKIIFFVAAAHYLDAIHQTMTGIFRGAGMQYRLMRILLCAHWFVTVPGAYLLGIVLEMDEVGIMIGLLCGLAIAIPFITVFDYMRWDWDILAREASKKNQIIENNIS